MQLKNNSHGEAPVAKMWRNAYSAAIHAGRMHEVAVNEADKAVEAYKERFEQSPAQRDVSSARGCPLCSGDGPYFTDEEITKRSKGKYTWDNVCKWCRCSVYKNDRPQDLVEYNKGPSAAILKRAGY